MAHEADQVAVRVQADRVEATVVRLRAPPRLGSPHVDCVLAGRRDPAPRMKHEIPDLTLARDGLGHDESATLVLHARQNPPPAERSRHHAKPW